MLSVTDGRLYFFVITSLEFIFTKVHIKAFHFHPADTFDFVLHLSHFGVSVNHYTLQSDRTKAWGAIKLFVQYERTIFSTGHSQQQHNRVTKCVLES